MNFFDYHIKKVWFTDVEIWIELDNGKSASLLLKNFKPLLNATPEERNSYEITSDGSALHWEKLDEDLSAEGFFQRA